MKKISLFILPSLLVLLPLSALAQDSAAYPARWNMWDMMWGYGYGMPYAGGWFGGIFMVLWWVLIVSAIVSLVRWMRHGSLHRHHGSSALDILKERYAKGEINKQEFEEKKKDIL